MPLANRSHSEGLGRVVGKSRNSEPHNQNPRHTAPRCGAECRAGTFLHLII